MIESFRHKGLKRFFEHGSLAGIQASHAKRLRLLLTILNSERDISSIDQPGLNLHVLQGSKPNRWAMRVSGNWRVTFEFFNGNARAVNYEDYH